MMAKTALAQFYVVTRTNQILALQRVPLTAALQTELQDDFLAQASDFLDNKDQVEFAPSYQPDKGEVFRINNYTLPDFLQMAVTSPQNFPALKSPFTAHAPWVKAILVAIPPNDKKSDPLYLFQYFDRRRILNTERTIIFRSGTFGHLTAPGIVIGSHLDAIISGDSLVFHSFHLTSQFLHLHQYFEKATEQDIREFVSHKLFVGGDADSVIAVANDVTRKRISMVLKAGMLNSGEVTPEGIKVAAKKFDIELTLEGKPGKTKVRFPSEAADVINLLHLLAEGFYIGPISGEPYVANSYRKFK